MRTPLTRGELMERFKAHWQDAHHGQFSWSDKRLSIGMFTEWLTEHTVVLERENDTPPPADPDLSQLGNRDLIYGTPPEPVANTLPFTCPPWPTPLFPSNYVVPPVWRFIYSRCMKEGLVLAHDECSAREQAIGLLEEGEWLEQIWLEGDLTTFCAEPCYSCGSTEGVSYGPCPYQSEINDDETPLWICDGCRDEATRDI